MHAISLRVAAQTVGLAPGPVAVLLGHTVHATPLAAIVVAARLATTPTDLVDAAHDLGAGPLGAFLHVQLPWLRPALGGALLLAALTSFDEFVRSFFLGGYEATLPVLVFGRMRSGLTPEINALATSVTLATVCVAAVASRPPCPVTGSVRAVPEEGMGFEPTVHLDSAQRFSKPPPSAARPPLR